ncbi:MAG: transporter permease protein, partial [Myxococcaceae bacterium]|nr:transporter permease protein [Myxococcaceae bacterium]
MLALLRLISLRHIFGSPLRSSITVMGIAVGVATMVGIAAINTSVMDAFRSTIDTIAGKADLTIAGTPIGFDDALLEKVQKLEGVTHAAGSVTAIAPVQGSPGESLYVMGVDLLDDGFFRTYEGVDRDVGQMADDLEFLNSTDRMLVSERFAREHKLKTGDKFTLQTAKGAADFIIHGLLKETGPIKAFGGSVGVMYLGSAQAAFHRDRNLDRIDVAIDPKLGVDVMKPRLEALAGAGMEVDRPDRRGQSVEKMIRSFQLGLNLGSGVALLVGIFLVYNTVAIGVVQRRREIGTLRALGSTRFRIRALFTLEAAVLGLFGTIVGIPLGTLVARLAISWVAGTISSIYIQVNAKDVFVGPQEMVLGAALGILGSVFAALRPAVVASSVQPVEALRRDVAAGADMANLKSWPTMLAVVLASLIYPCTLIPQPAENFPLGGYLAMFLIMMVTTLISPLVLRALQRVYQWPSERALGIPGRLAADNFARAPVRTAVPVSALAIGVGMTICIAGFVGSFQKSSEKWIDQSIPADLFVTSSAKVGGVQNTPMNAELRDPIEAMAGVNKVDMVRIYPSDVLDRGSTFTMETPTGPHTYKVGGVITDYSSDQGTVFMDRRYFTRDFNDHLVDTFQVYMKDPTKIEAVRREINEKFGTRHDLYVLSNVELRKEAYDLIGNAFAVTYAMEGVAVLLALLGVINTLLAAVLDRTREIGLLRAIGAARSHVIKLFIGEAALIGLTG